MSDSNEPLVDSVSAAAYTIPTDQPEADGTLSWDSTTVVVVHVTAGGRTGMGWTYSSKAAATVVDDLLSSAVQDHSAFDVPGANVAMMRAVRNAGRDGVVATAISAVDIALWDLNARLLDQPLIRLLGKTREDVPIYGSGGFTTYDDARTERQVEHWLNDCGVDMVKIKIGESWGGRVERDLHRTALVRRLVGDREVFVDANGGYPIARAIRVGHALDDLGVTWFEEPVSSNDLIGLRRVRTALRADVTAGEYGYDLQYFQKMVAAEAVDCLQIDVTRCGGITEFIRGAAVAAANELDVSGHCAPHVHAAFAASVPNFRHVEFFHDHERIEEQLLFDGADPPQDGRLLPSDSPGHGLSVKHSDAEQWRVM
jgi:L-alanine-DL-glutamate epimerase-like enolase superfamily enzyme